jgi:hypothetical protein
MKIEDIKKLPFQDAYDLLQEHDIGNWDAVNDKGIIISYCTDMMEKGVIVSHIIKALEDNESDEDLYNIWLGNSMNTPTPINTVNDLIEALEISDNDLEPLKPKRFSVNFEKTFDLCIDVEAIDDEEALQKAEEIMSKKTKDELIEMSQEGYFEHTYTDEDN